MPSGIIPTPVLRHGSNAICPAISSHTFLSTILNTKHHHTLSPRFIFSHPSSSMLRPRSSPPSNRSRNAEIQQSTRNNEHNAEHEHDACFARGPGFFALREEGSRASSGVSAAIFAEGMLAWLCDFAAQCFHSGM